MTEFVVVDWPSVHQKRTGPAKTGQNGRLSRVLHSGIQPAAARPNRYTTNFLQVACRSRAASAAKKRD